MSTSCTIAIVHEKGTASVYMSHDGSPDTVLSVLVALFNEYDCPNSEQLYDAYLEKYQDPESRTLVATQSHLNGGEVGDWYYLVEDGQLSVFCHKSWASRGQTHVHPMAYVFLGGVLRSYQTQIAYEISHNLRALSSMGIDLAPMQD